MIIVWAMAQTMIMAYDRMPNAGLQRRRISAVRSSDLLVVARRYSRASSLLQVKHYDLVPFSSANQPGS